MASTAKIASVLGFVKVGAVAVIKEVKANGFQPADLLAPLKEGIFLAKIPVLVDDLAAALEEVKALKGKDYLSVAGIVFDEASDIYEALKA